MTLPAITIHIFISRPLSCNLAHRICAWLPSWWRGLKTTNSRSLCDNFTHNNECITRESISLSSLLPFFPPVHCVMIYGIAHSHCLNWFFFAFKSSLSHFFSRLDWIHLIWRLKKSFFLLFLQKDQFCESLSHINNIKKVCTRSQHGWQCHKVMNLFIIP